MVCVVAIGIIVVFSILFLEKHSIFQNFRFGKASVGIGDENFHGLDSDENYTW